MFRLLDRVSDGIQPMLQYLESHIIDQGLADMMASAEIITQDSEKYIEQLLELFRRFSLLVKQAFNDDPRFLTARDKVWLRLRSQALGLTHDMTAGLQTRSERHVGLQTGTPDPTEEVCLVWCDVF